MSKWEPGFYATAEKEDDFAYWETDTWDWWRFWFPLGLLILLVVALWAEERYTRPPKQFTAPTIMWAYHVIGTESVEGRNFSGDWNVYVCENSGCHVAWETAPKCEVGEHLVFSADGDYKCAP